MKRSTAIRNLREMADTATEHSGLGGADVGWPLEELWVTGELLEPCEELEVGEVVLSLDLPPGELTWRADNPVAGWVGTRLRLGKRPFLWWLRPHVWPAWNARHRRLVRVWSAGDGMDATALEHLAQRRFGDLYVVAPSEEELEEQMVAELAACRHHLDALLDRYWDREWRRANRWGGGPEDHLWRAAQGLRDIEQALGGSIG